MLRESCADLCVLEEGGQYILGQDVGNLHASTLLKNVRSTDQLVQCYAHTHAHADTCAPAKHFCTHKETRTRAGALQVQQNKADTSGCQEHGCFDQKVMYARVGVHALEGTCLCACARVQAGWMWWCMRVHASKHTGMHASKHTGMHAHTWMHMRTISFHQQRQLAHPCAVGTSLCHAHHLVIHITLSCTSPYCGTCIPFFLPGTNPPPHAHHRIKFQSGTQSDPCQALCQAHPHIYYRLASAAADKGARHLCTRMHTQNVHTDARTCAPSRSVPALRPRLSAGPRCGR